MIITLLMIIVLIMLIILLFIVVLSWQLQKFFVARFHMPPIHHQCSRSSIR